MAKPWIIPPELMVSALQQTVAITQGKPGVDNWGEKESVLCRSFLPEEYHHVETDLIRRYAGNIRRNPDKFGYKSPRSGTMGRSKKKMPPEYTAYIESAQWKMFVDMSFWPMWERVFGDRMCSLCCSKTDLQAHHRHYNTFKYEKPTDCVPLCAKCHDKFHGE